MIQKLLLACAVLWCMVSTSVASELAPIKLPPPDTRGGKPLLQCLNDRKTDRDFSAKKLPVKVLSNLLWAAYGINRADSGKRTAPSAHNWQEIDVYVAMEEGLYLYHAQSHVLTPVLKDDLRGKTSRLLQPSRSSIAAAPVHLIYVIDYSRTSRTLSEEDKKFYAGADAAFIAQNVYLFCASEGLATGVRAFVDKDALAGDMKLQDKQKVALVQTVGYPP